MFGLRGVNISLYTDASLKQELNTNVKVESLAKKTIYVTPAGSTISQCSAQVVDRPYCHFANVESGNKKGTLLLENPRGDVSYKSSMKKCSFSFRVLNYWNNLNSQTVHANDVSLFSFPVLCAAFDDVT